MHLFQKEISNFRSLLESMRMGSEDEHAVAVGEEAVFFGDGFVVGAEDELAGGKGGGEHDECALGQVEDGEQGVCHFPLKAGVDEDIRSIICWKNSMQLAISKLILCWIRGF